MVAEWVGFPITNEVLSAKVAAPHFRFWAIAVSPHPIICKTWRIHHRQNTNNYNGLYFFQRARKWILLKDPIRKRLKPVRPIHRCLFPCWSCRKRCRYSLQWYNNVSQRFHPPHHRLNNVRINASEE